MGIIVTLYLSWLILVLINGQKIHEDPMNMHTYDWMDWFLFVFAILVFGATCLIIGCLCHKYLVKRNTSNQLIKDLNDNILHNSLNDKETEMCGHIEIVHKTTKTKLTTIEESQHEEDFDCNGGDAFDTFIR